MAPSPHGQPAGPEAPGPAELVLSATIARRFYLDGRTKIDIAAELGLSRFKVARLLDAARDSGLVRIEFDLRGNLEIDLSSALQARYGLAHALVVRAPDQDEAVLRAHLGKATAELLGEIVTAQDVLGLAWSRSLMAMRNELTRLAPCTVVQLTGALSRPDVDESSIELVRDVARIGGGPAFRYYAPMILPQATTARQLRSQPEIARALARFPSVTKALVGFGSIDPPASTVLDAISAAEARGLRRLGVVAELSGVLIDADGRPVATPLTDRMITVTAAQLRAVPEVLTIAYGPGKAPALRAALRGGLVSGLVTHVTLAQELLALA